MAIFRNIIGGVFIFSTIIGCSISANAQSIERIYNDAEIFNLKGHVKEFATFSDLGMGEINDTVQKAEFEPNGQIVTDDNEFITRDSINRLIKIYSETLYLNEDGETIAPESCEDTTNVQNKKSACFKFTLSDFILDGRELKSNNKVYKMLEESGLEEYSIVVETSFHEIEWNDNNVTSQTLLIPGCTYTWIKGLYGWLQLGTGWYQHESYTYDSKGNIIRVNIQYKVSEECYEYKYLEFDSHDNWTKREVTRIDEDNEPLESYIEIRTITYYE